MLSELHSLNLKLCSKQYNKIFVLHLIVAPQLCSGWRHNSSTKTRQAGRANEHSLMSMFLPQKSFSCFLVPWKLSRTLELFVFYRQNLSAIDILAYWKGKADKMPMLAKVARQFFALPVTSASSERLFSAAGNVVTSARTLLNSERAEQLIFIHDNYWLKEPTIKSMKFRSDKERGKDRPRPPLSQQVDDPDDPQPGPSSQSMLTPKSSSKAPKTPRSTARRAIELESETDSD
jgi:hAT family C-terminal dimerisation region